MGKIFAQIYSLIRQERKGVLRALKTLSEIGYDGVEIISSDTNGMPAADFKKYLSDLDLQVLSAHALNEEKDFEFGRELGIKYCQAPVHANLASRDTVLKTAEKLNAFGRRVAPYGMKTVYHNHANEFLAIDGVLPEDILIENTDPDLVAFEFDVGWARLADVDCAAYLRKHAGRFPLIHVKECNRTAKTKEDFEHFPKRIMEYARKLAGAEFHKKGAPPKFPEEAKAMMYESRNWNVALGEGIIDWPALFEAAEAQGVEAYINEREYYHITGNPGATAEGAAKLDYAFLMKENGLKF